jgi:hypothetical protein
VNQELKVYIICPVRKATATQALYVSTYVESLERNGHKAHLPPRDVDQSNDDGGVRICRQHLQAMAECDEVHVFWTGSEGCHFDLGMAFMLNHLRQEKGRDPIRFRYIANVDGDKEKSFVNVLHALVDGDFNKPTDWSDWSLWQGPLAQDSGAGFLHQLHAIGVEDAEGLKVAAQSYGHSWKSRGGVGAFMMLARKWDRLENRLRKCLWDIFRAIATDDRGEGVIDDVRDLRRYLMLVEGEMRARGFKRTHRDNAKK